MILPCLNSIYDRGQWKDSYTPRKVRDILRIENLDRCTSFASPELLFRMPMLAV